LKGAKALGMDLALGTIIEGKVTGITKFGAFVALPEGKSGMVHISEIANTFVNDIKDHIAEGQTVKVKVISIDKEGRINLSIKKAEEQTYQSRDNDADTAGAKRFAADIRKGPQTFEDKLKKFMADSESKMSDLKSYTDKKVGSRRGGRK